MKRFRYTEEHVEFLRAGYQSMNTHDLTREFNKRFKTKKTETAIKTALSNRKIVCGRHQRDRLISRWWLFNPEQVQFLKDNYAGRSIAEMTDIFNAKFKTKMKRSQIKTAISNRHITSGRTGRFEKGSVSWNKGKKGFMGPNRTSFKKGNTPANHRSVGSERICSKDGYILIKVDEPDPHFGFPTRWKHKHIHLWEQENGPVPDGFVLKFKDGDILNIDPKNLMLIPQALNLRLNQHGYNEMPDELKPSILALAELEVKTFSLDK